MAIGLLTRQPAREQSDRAKARGMSRASLGLAATSPLPPARVPAALPPAHCLNIFTQRPNLRAK